VFNLFLLLIDLRFPNLVYRVGDDPRLVLLTALDRRLQGAQRAATVDVNITLDGTKGRGGGSAARNSGKASCDKSN